MLWEDEQSEGDGVLCIGSALEGNCHDHATMIARDLKLFLTASHPCALELSQPELALSYLPLHISKGFAAFLVARTPVWAPR